MLTFSALVAGSFSLGSLAANEIAPIALNSVRFVIAAVIIGVLGILTGSLRRDDYRAPWRYVILGGLFSVYFVLMFEGLKTAPPVSAAAVFTLTPVMSAGLGFLLLGQIMTFRMSVALFIGALGALWVIFRADFAAMLAFEVGIGEVIYFFGCLAHAACTPMVRKLNRGEAAISFTFGTLIAGAVMMLTLGWSSVWAVPWLDLPGIVWVTIFYTSIFASAATFVLLQFATLHLPSSKVMAYTYLTPTWVIFWEVMLGSALPAPILFFGVGLTCLALLLLLRRG